MKNSFDNLPDNVKAHCYFNVETKEITLWDETSAQVVCTCHYPWVIKAAIRIIRGKSFAVHYAEDIK